MKKYSNPLHEKPLNELEDLYKLAEEAEQAGCELMNDLRSSNYGVFDGLLHTVEYRMILRKIELFNSLYLNLNIPALTEKEINDLRSELDLVGEEDYSDFSIGVERDYYDDDFCNYTEVCYNGELNNLIAKFTSLDGVGDFKECQFDCRGENNYDALSTFLCRLKDKDLLDSPSSLIIESGVLFTAPYSACTIEMDGEDIDIDSDRLLNAVFGGDEEILEKIIEKNTDEEYAILSELYYVRSKKIGLALEAANDTEKKPLLEKVVNKMSNLFYLVDTDSSFKDSGISDGDFFLSYASMSNMESEEGEGAPMVLRGMGLKLYGFIAQELADRILSVEKKKGKEVKPEIDVRVKTA